jgi:hypothetical protein
VRVGGVDSVHGRRCAPRGSQGPRWEIFGLLQMLPVQRRVSSESRGPEGTGNHLRFTRQERASRRENNPLGDLAHFGDPVPSAYVLIELHPKPKNVLRGRRKPPLARWHRFTAIRAYCARGKRAFVVADY